MSRTFLSKLLVPPVAEFVARPRLMAGATPRALSVQAPSGSGKTVFLAQWLASQALPSVYYQLDEQDQDGRLFAAHLLAGFRRRWPDWSPPDGLADDPTALAAELVNEAVGRPPLILVLDRLEAAAGQAEIASW